MLLVFNRADSTPPPRGHIASPNLFYSRFLLLTNFFRCSLKRSSTTSSSRTLVNVFWEGLNLDSRRWPLI